MDNTTTTAAAKFIAVCSVCLQPYLLNTAKGKTANPIRHGFNAYHVRHGQSGGWHTGPCAGVTFPNFGKSTQGTVWALGQAQEQLAHVVTRLETHATRPELTWTETLYRNDGNRAPRVVKLTDGMPGSYMPATSHPDYASLWGSIQSGLVGAQSQLQAQIKTYEAAIAGWKPKAPTAAPAKVEMVHLLRTYKTSSNPDKNQPYNGPSCRRVATWDAPKYKLTNDAKLVTCKNCKAH